MPSTRGTATDVAVVVPVYNEAGVVGGVVAELLELFPTVVCVDDGSDDSSAEEIAATRARLVRHPLNLGQGAALQTGIEFALLDPGVGIVVTYDADGQHQVDDVLTMVETLRRDDVDIVFGSRFLDDRTEVSTAKRAVLKLATVYSRWTTGLALTDTHNGIRALTRHAAERIRIRQNGMAHASEFLAETARLGLRYREVPVHIHYTDYSKAKGQPLLNSVNIIFDLLFR